MAGRAYVTARGLTTSPIPYRETTFAITFDFVDHAVLIETAGSERESIPLRPMSVAAFHAEVIARLRQLGIDVRFGTMPCGIAGAVRFEQDHVHAAYDPEYARRFGVYR